MSGLGFGDLLRRRELGLKQPPGVGDACRLRLYYNLQPFDSFAASAATGPDHGAVFNLQFSPDGLVFTLTWSDCGFGYEFEFSDPENLCNDTPHDIPSLSSFIRVPG
jgi:hypothetical protein